MSRNFTFSPNKSEETQPERPYSWLISGMSLLFLISAIFILTGCSHQLAKVYIHDSGEYQINFSHEGGEVEFWTDLDLEFLKPADIFYEMTFYQDDTPVGQALCQPLAAEEKRMHRYVDHDGLVKISFFGQMACGLNLPAGEIEGVILFNAQAEQLKIFRADLILK